jgi:hypothetical protein
LSSPFRAAALLFIGAACTVAVASGQATPPGTAYAASRAPSTGDTLRSTAEVATAGFDALERGAVVRGYLSCWGLPPIPGDFIVSDSGLVFQSLSGSTTTRASSLSLAYIDPENGRAHYLFRIESGVFETDAPGPLLDLALHSASRDILPRSPRAGTGVKPATAAEAPLDAARQIGRSAYADSLYTLFGRPRASLGLVGRRGRAAGRLGEYIASRDSLALDPSHMTGEAQLRHALAHELGHRWQARAKAQVAALWNGVPGIRDPKRYGYGDRSEHQAEAIAFAVNFLQMTAVDSAPGSSLALLDHYELLVPGTRTLTRYLLLQPLYRHHPLRSVLTTSRITYALEK